MRIVLTEFARTRLFGEEAGGPRIRGCDAGAFVDHLTAHPPERLLAGYAPFCQLAVYRNWTATPVSALPITSANAHLLRSAYEARTPAELPVLTRWLEGIEAPVAAYLLVILYSAEQLATEGERIDGDWGVVGCLAVNEPVEPPMAPITMMRNALGVDEGGSGAALDREAYLRSVAFWSRHANVRTPIPSEEGSRP